MVAIDARAPLYDGGICTRVDCVSLGIMVNRDARRFYDEGEDFWPKRYAIWGRLVALQPGQVGTRIIDAKAVGRFMPPVFPARRPTRCPIWPASWACPSRFMVRTVDAFNAACQRRSVRPRRARRLPHRRPAPPKTHWARPIDTPPFYGYTLKPGVTFTYLGTRVDAPRAMHFGGQPSPNLFAAGEVMAGNVLGQGYTAGVGMTIRHRVSAAAAGKEAADAVA
jgi:tricarballylate dehydrogenase